MEQIEPKTVYDAIGGERTMLRLVEEFYGRVEKNEVLRPLFPDSFDDVQQRQFWFLTQLFGGPRLYEENRGAPMLRMRHLPFPITPKHASEWLGCMEAAIEATGITKPAQDILMERFTMVAHHMVNSEG